MKRVGLCVLLVAALSSCLAAEEPGFFSLRFSFEPEPTQDLYVWVRVEDRSDPDRAPTLASDGPQLRPQNPSDADRFNFDLSGIPNGDDRVVVVEARAAADEDLPVLYYGLSEPFSIMPGSNVIVDVSSNGQLAPPRTRRHDGSFRLLDGAAGNAISGSRIGLDEATSLVVEVRGAFMAGVRVANDASLLVGRTELSLEEGRCRDDAQDDIPWQICEFDWSLVNGFSEASIASLAGPRSVFVELLDENDYESEALSDFVILDPNPPQLVVAEVRPPLAGAGQTVVVAVTLDEPLPDEPIPAALFLVNPDNGLRLDDAALPDLGLPTRVGDSTTYTWSYVTPSEVALPDLGFEVEATDLVGNETVDPIRLRGDAGPVLARNDVTPPTLTSSTLAAAEVSLFGLDGGDLAFSVTLEESAVAPCPGQCPVVRLNGRELANLSVTPGETPLSFDVRYPVDPSDWPDGTQEDIDVTLRWSDRAQNTADIRIPGALRFDFRAPTLAREDACRLSPGLAGANDTLEVVLEVSEPLLGPPSLNALPADLGLFTAPPESQGQRYVWTQAAEALGEVAEITLAPGAEDLAGNASAEALCTLTATVDAAAPVISNAVVEVFDGAVARPSGIAGPGHLVRATFGLVESRPDPLGPLVTLGASNGAPMVGGCIDGACSYELLLDSALHGAVEGPQSVRVLARDEAGNLTDEPVLAGVTVIVDFTPPQAVCSVVPDRGEDGALVRGESVFLQVSPTEEVIAAPDVRVTFTDRTGNVRGDIDWLTYDSGSRYRYQAVVSSELGEGRVALRVEAEDRAGNVTPPGETACLGGLLTRAVDGVAPRISHLEITPSHPIGEWAGVNVEFRLIGGADANAVPPRAFLSEIPMRLVSALDDDGAQRVSFFHLLLGSEPEGPATIRVEVEDPAGNSAFDGRVPPGLIIDFTAPGAECELSAAFVGHNQSVFVTARLDEPLDPESLEIAGGLEFDLVSADEAVGAPRPVLEFEYRQLVARDGTYPVSFLGTDRAGNPFDGSPLCAFDLVVDTEAPAFADDGTEPYGGPVLFGGPDPETVSIDFTLLEANPRLRAGGVPDSIEVRLDGRELGFVFFRRADSDEAAGRWAFTYEYRTTPDDWPGADREAVPTVRWADRAGNLLEAALPLPQPLRFDFRPPSVDDCQLSPSNAAEGAALRYGFTVSEALGEIPTLQGTAPVGLFGAEPELSAGDRVYLWRGEATGFASVASYEVFVDVVDVAGNVAPDRCRLSGAIDSEAPRVRDETLSLTPARTDAEGLPIFAARAGTQLRASVVIEGLGSEELEANPPQLWLGSDEAVSFGAPSVTPIGDAVLVGWRLTLDPAEHPEGRRGVRLVVTDGAGNQVVVDPLGAAPVEVDYTPPGAECEVTPGDRPAARNESLRLVVDSTEALAPGSPDVDAGTFDFGDGATGDLRTVFVGSTREVAADSSVAWTVDLEDLAGNQALGACSGEAQIDVTASTVVASNVSARVELPVASGTFVETGLFARDGSEVSVDFELSEPVPVGVEPAIRIGDVTLSGGVPSDERRRWAFAHVVEASADGEVPGVVAVTLNTRDEAGNLTVASLATLTLDFEAPTVETCGVIPDPELRPAREREALQLVVQVAEAMASGFPAVDTLVELGEPNTVGLTTNWLRTVANGEVIGEPFQVRLRDLAGNESAPESCRGNLRLDGMPPAALLLDQETVGTLIHRDAFGFAASFDEDLGGAPRLFMGDFELPAATGAGAEWRWDYAIGRDDFVVDGEKALRLEAEDVAGNLYVNASAGVVNLDLTRPSASCFLTPDVVAGPALAGETLVFRINTNEPQAEGFPSIVARRRSNDAPGVIALFDFGEITGSGLSYRVEAPVPELEGEITLNVELLDLNGNGALNACVATIPVDGIVPEIETVVQGFPGPATIAIDDRIDLRLTATEALDTAPIMQIGDVTIDGFQGFPPEIWRFERQFLEVDAEAIVGGENEVFVILTDEAGNVATDRIDGGVFVDLSRPFIQCSVSPGPEVRPARAGEILRFLISANEPLQAEETSLNLQLIDPANGRPLRDPDTDEVQTLPFVRTAGSGGSVLFEYEVPLSSGLELSYDFSVSSVDLRGNDGQPFGEDCQGVGAVDARFIDVVSSSVSASVPHPFVPGSLVTGQRAQTGGRVDIILVLDEAPADGSLEVFVGEQPADLEVEDGTRYELSATIPAPVGGTDTVPVLVRVEDDAGNVTTSTIGTLTVDDVSPSVVADTQTLSRDDGYVHPDFTSEVIWVSDGGATVSFATDEGLGLPPVVTLSDGENVWTETDEDFLTGATFVRYDLPLVETGDYQGPLALSVTLVDLAGNRSDVALGTVNRDLEAPAIDAALVTSGVLALRAPWGAEETSGVANTRLRVCPAPEGESWDFCDDGPTEVVAVGTTVEVVRGNAGGCGGDVLATSVREAAGGFELEFPGDLPDLCLRTSDRAGNRSEAAEVSRVEWIATLGSKVAGSRAQNPHTLTRHAHLEARALIPTGQELGAADGLTTRNGAGPSSSGAPSWRRFITTTSAGSVPTAIDPMVTYDTTRGLVLLFGGLLPSNMGVFPSSDELWAFDGAGWTRLVPTDPEDDGNPAGRSDAGFAHDPVSGLTYLLGGDVSDDDEMFWAWDGLSWERLERIPAEMGGGVPGGGIDRIVAAGGTDGGFLHIAAGSTAISRFRNGAFELLTADANLPGGIDGNLAYGGEPSASASSTTTESGGSPRVET